MPSIRSIAEMIANHLDRVAIPVDEEGEQLFSEDNPGYIADEVMRATIPTIDEILEEVTEIEEHIHNDERWWGTLEVANQDNAIEWNVNRPYTLVSGNFTWGAVIPIIGRFDNPVLPWQTTFDLHRFMVAGVENAFAWRIRFLYGDQSFLEALNAERWSEVMFIATGVGANLIGFPVDVRMRPIPVGWNVWAQCANPTNADEISIFVGAHGYPVRSM